MSRSLSRRGADPEKEYSRTVSNCHLRVEAHELHFAAAYFDAIVSVDAYHYFGTEESYLSYLSRFARPGATLAIAVPSVRRGLDGAPPPGLEPYWHDDMFTFHTPEWWRTHVARTTTVHAADWHDDGWVEWLLWCEVCGDHLRPKGFAQGDDECAEMLRVDNGRNVGLARIVAEF